MFSEAIQTISKIARWQKKHKIKGAYVPAKGVNKEQTPNAYRGQQWGSGPNNDKSVGRRRTRFYADRFNTKAPTRRTVSDVTK